MDMDWKTIAAALVLAIVLSAMIFVPVSMAAGGGNSMKNQSGNKTQSSKSNQSTKANNTSARSSTGQSQGYVPLGGLAGLGSKLEGAGPREKGWMGAASNNPWLYGPSVYPRRQAQNFWRNLYGQATNSSTRTNKT